jgi:hypothetical protein
MLHSPASIPRKDRVSDITTGRFLPNRLALLFLRALEEDIGREGNRAVLRTCGIDGRGEEYPPDDLQKSISFEWFSRVCATLASEYGGDGAQSMVRRSVREAFRRALPPLAELAESKTSPLFLQTGRSRMDLGMQGVTRLLGAISDIECSFLQAGESRLFVLYACPECTGRTGHPLCAGMAGLVRGALDWLGVEPALPVTETHCMAAGAPFCEFSFPEPV